MHVNEKIMKMAEQLIIAHVSSVGLGHRIDLERAIEIAAGFYTKGNDILDGVIHPENANYYDPRPEDDVKPDLY